MAKELLTECAKRTEPDNMDPALRVIMHALGVPETGERTIYQNIISVELAYRGKLFSSKDTETDFDKGKVIFPPI